MAEVAGIGGGVINKFNGKKRHRYRSIFYSSKKVVYGGEVGIIACDNILLPNTLSIYTEKNRKRLLTAIQSLHKSVRNGLVKIKLDFSNTVKVYSDAMIWLYAEVDNLLNINKNLRFYCKKPHNEKVSHVLHQIGMYKMCKVKFKPKKKFNDVIYWRTCSGKHVIAEQYDYIVDNQHNLFHPDVDLFGGCAEATKNARKHAYIEPRALSAVQFDETAWWIFSQIKDGNMYVCVCDLGIGIPATLPRSRAELVRELFQKLKNETTSADLIRAALDSSKSRTKKDYHGNGLPKIASIVQETKQGSVAIHSLDGYVRINEGNYFEYNFRTRLPGTIISWKLPVRAQDESDD